MNIMIEKCIILQERNENKTIQIHDIKLEPLVCKYKYKQYT